MQAGRDLDALIAEKVMGLGVVDMGEECFYYKAPLGTCGDYCINHDHILPAYSTDIAAAWEVFNKVLSSRLYDGDISTSNGGTTWCCCFTTRKTVIDWADTAPLAICLAALRTVR